VKDTCLKVIILFYLPVGGGVLCRNISPSFCFYKMIFDFGSSEANVKEMIFWYLAMRYIFSKTWIISKNQPDSVEADWLATILVPALVMGLTLWWAGFFSDPFLFWHWGPYPWQALKKNILRDPIQDVWLMVIWEATCCWQWLHCLSQGCYCFSTYCGISHRGW